MSDLAAFGGKRLRPIAVFLADSDIRVMCACALALLVVLVVLPIPLSVLPPPIGPAAEQFGAGARTTVLLTLVSGAIGLVIGITLALARLSNSWIAKKISRGIVWVVRGTPLLVQILFVYFTLPALLPGFKLSDFWSVVLALSVNVGAYNSEVIRAGIQAIPAGQAEAANALGLGRMQTFCLVLSPQAIQIALPPLVNNVVALLKDSSLGYAVGVVELTLIGNRVQAESFRPVPIFLTIACVYLILTTVITTFSSALEHWMSKGKRR